MPSCRVDTSRLRITNNRLDHEHHQQDKYNVTRAHSGSLSYPSAHQHTCYDSENCDTQLKCVDTDKSFDSDKCVDSDQCAHLNKCSRSENYDMTVKCVDSEKCVDSVECKDTVEFDATAKCVDYIKCADIVSREDHVKCVDYTKCVDSVGCTVQCIDSVKSVNGVKRIDIVKCVDPLIHNDATPLDSTINGTSGYSPTGPTRVLDYLYVGSADDAGSYSVLRELGITHLLNCAAEQNGTQTKSAMSRFGGNTGVLQHVGFAADDNAAYDILQHLSYAVNFINASYKQGRTVLVYCAKGINRSVAITVGYLMQECQMSFAQAFGAVKTKRQHVLTNTGFVEQLQNFSPATVHSDS